MWEEQLVDPPIHYIIVDPPIQYITSVIALESSVKNKPVNPETL